MNVFATMSTRCVARESVLPCREYQSSFRDFYRHFFDSSHRETYESAHSVMLSIFAAHARKAGEVPDSLGKPSFAEQITPFYARCLAEVRQYFVLPHASNANV